MIAVLFWILFNQRWPEKYVSNGVLALVVHMVMIGLDAFIRTYFYEQGILCL